MNRPRATWIIAAALLLGCQGRRMDPFGQTTIPPPGTGAIAAPGGYAPPAFNGAPAVSIPSVSVPNTPVAPQFAPAAGGTPTLPAAAPAFAPAAGNPGATAPVAPAPAGPPRVLNPSPPWNGTSGWSPPTNPLATSSPPATSPLVRSPRLQPASPFESTMGAGQPTPLVTPVAATRIAPMAAPTPTPIAPTPTPIVAPVAPPQVVVIDSGSLGQPLIRVEDASRTASLQPKPVVATAVGLPSAGGWTSGDRPKVAATAAQVSSTPVSPTPNVAQTSHNEASILVPSGSGKSNFIPTTVTTPAASPDFESRYGRAPDYTQIKGKLEYSAARKQWKLRYIPIDAAGPTDQYGGSVVLSGVPDMSQYHDGDFASVEGAVGKRADDAKDFAAEYQVRQIQRVQ